MWEKASMTARSAIRHAHNGDVSIAYTQSGGGIDLGLSDRDAGAAVLDRLGPFARVILFDKRAMGLSDRDAGAYTLENVVDDALAVVPDDLDVSQTAIFGISEPPMPASPKLRITPRACSCREAQEVLGSHHGRLDLSVQHRFLGSESRGRLELHKWWVGCCAQA
jgi:hypothetical protein